MKNIDKKLTLVVSTIALLSSGAVRTSSAPELQPLAATTPLQFNECEHTVSDPIKGHWTRTPYGFTAEWENGARATLQFTRNDSDGVVLERRDGSGSTAGITATYAGKMVEANEFEGTVTWTNQGKPQYGEWSISCDGQGNGTESESSYGGDICGAWTRADHKITGHWQNGADAALTMERYGTNEVVVTRHDPDGTSGGMIARYAGTINANGAVTGSVSWTQNGKSWSGRWRMTH